MSFVKAISFNFSAICVVFLHKKGSFDSLPFSSHVEIFSSLEYFTLHTLVVVAPIPVGSIFSPIIALTMLDFPLLVSPIYIQGNI